MTCTITRGAQCSEVSLVYLVYLLYLHLFFWRICRIIILYLMECIVWHNNLTVHGNGMKSLQNSLYLLYFIWCICCISILCSSNLLYFYSVFDGMCSTMTRLFAPSRATKWSEVTSAAFTIRFISPPHCQCFCTILNVISAH